MLSYTTASPAEEPRFIPLGLADAATLLGEAPTDNRPETRAALPFH